MRNKKAQIFILAAVIISVIVMSMATVANFADVLREPVSFYDYSHDVREEAGWVVDYEIYSGFSDGLSLSDFVEVIASNLRDQDAEANFMFIYGDNVSLVVENYGADVAKLSTPGVGNSLLPGSLNIESSISYGGITKEINSSDYLSLDATGSRVIFVNTSYVNVTILKNDFSFPIREYRQVIFLAQKEDGDEAYISV